MNQPDDTAPPASRPMADIDLFNPSFHLSPGVASESFPKLLQAATTNESKSALS